MTEFTLGDISKIDPRLTVDPFPRECFKWDGEMTILTVTDEMTCRSIRCTQCNVRGRRITRDDGLSVVRVEHTDDCVAA